MKLLSSREHPRLRLLRRLAAHPRECRKSGWTVLDGVHLLRSLLDRGGCPDWGAVTARALARSEVAACVAESGQRGCDWVELPPGRFSDVAPTAHPSGVLAVYALPAPRTSPARAHDFTLLLEDIQDPGNLGTLLRAAQGAGVRQVGLSRGCAEPWSPRVLRAGMGAHFGLDLFEPPDLADFARAHGGVLAAAADGAQTAWDGALAGCLGIAIGNEGAGLGAAVRAACAGSVRIPLAPGCESLNAAMAGAILLFERARQVARAEGTTAGDAGVVETYAGPLQL